MPSPPRTGGALDGLAIRIGIHVGTAQRRGGDFFGPELSVGARIMGVAHGGQVLVSGAARAVTSPTGSVELIDVGDHRLRDIPDAVRLFQVAADGIIGEFPPLRSLNTIVTNLPTQASSFIGRRAEVAAVRRMLVEHRVVTLTGVGGTGKTRLAVEVAAAELSSYDDGVCFVELAPVADPAQVPMAIATSLDLHIDGPADIADRIESSLRGRRPLLVLDNCEHVIDVTADLVERLLRAAPGLRVLATSREAFEIDGERSYRVPSLAVGDDAGADSPAVALFLDRALAANPDFRADDEAMKTVAQICRRLDGIPLAIELAAARVRVMTPAEVLDRLDDRFALLTGGRRRTRQRQHTLEAVLDWSYDLLDEQEQAALRALGVFVGGWDLESAAHVLALEPIEAADVLDSLVAKSLVTTTTETAGTRFGFLETVRAYAEAKLVAADEAPAARGRHLEVCLSWMLPPFRIVGDDPRYFRLCREHGNLQVAMDWATERMDLDTLTALANGGGIPSVMLGRYQDALHRFEFLERHDPDLTPPGWTVRAMVAMCASDYELWPSAAERAVRDARACGDLELEAFAHGLLANFESASAPIGAVERMDAVVARADAVGDVEALKVALGFAAFQKIGAYLPEAALADVRRLQEVRQGQTAPLMSALNETWAELASLVVLGDAKELSGVPRLQALAAGQVSSNLGPWGLVVDAVGAMGFGVMREPEAAWKLLGRLAADRHRFEGLPLIADVLLTAYGVVAVNNGEVEDGRFLLERTCGRRTHATRAANVMTLLRAQGCPDDEIVERARARHVNRIFSALIPQSPDELSALLDAEVAKHA